MVWPLTSRRRMQPRSQWRASLPPRYWHIPLCALSGGAILLLADWGYFANLGALPNLRDIWPLVVLLPLICGSLITLGAGGASLGSRMIAAVVCAALIGVSYGVLSPVLIGTEPVGSGDVAINCVWRVFVCTILSVIGIAFVILLDARPLPSSPSS